MTQNLLKLRYKIIAAFFLPILMGFVIPDKTVIPVLGATSKDWNKNSFWYEPWGTSGVHKGIDIFAKKGTELVSATNGLVLYTGTLTKGGKVILILGPKWRLHYYAHLESIESEPFKLVSAHQKIGIVGDSGNAQGKPPHVHYSIVSLIPYPWLITKQSQGWKKMFYLDPVKIMKSGADE